MLRCRVAADLIHKGQYDAARDALGVLWRGVGQRPDVEGLDDGSAAEVLLQVGALSGWLGASRQAKGAQEAAKDLISESISLFKSLGQIEKAADAQSDLALCYWREGAYDEARVLLSKASAELAQASAEQRAIVLLRRVTVEYTAGRFNDALNLLNEHALLFDESQSPALIGSFHNHRALVFRRLGVVEGHADYLDRAIIEYVAAIHHYKLARNERYSACIENNLAFLLHKLGRYDEAHEYLDRAGITLVKLGDAGLLAQVDETRALVLIAEKQYREANKLIARAIQTLEQGGASALLADAMTVQGIARARLGAFEESIRILRQAASVAEESGALSNAGKAVLTLIEEHGARRVLSSDELYELYSRADRLLRDTQDAEDIARLRRCASIVLHRLAGVQLDDPNFTLIGAVHELEARLIGKALDRAGGSVTRAAKLLGIRHQTLGSILNTRHKRLQAKRTPAEKRLRSIIKEE